MGLSENILVKSHIPKLRLNFFDMRKNYTYFFVAEFYYCKLLMMPDLLQKCLEIVPDEQ